MAYSVALARFLDSYWIEDKNNINLTAEEYCGAQKLNLTLCIS